MSSPYYPTKYCTLGRMSTVLIFRSISRPINSQASSMLPVGWLITVSRVKVFHATFRTVTGRIWSEVVRAQSQLVILLLPWGRPEDTLPQPLGHPTLSGDLLTEDPPAEAVRGDGLARPQLRPDSLHRGGVRGGKRAPSRLAADENEPSTLGGPAETAGLWPEFVVLVVAVVVGGRLAMAVGRWRPFSRLDVLVVSRLPRRCVRRNEANR